jgi:DNA mismatch endonuclease (patch repair protein)
MADSLTKVQRSKNMASIRSKDTKPELTVRRFLYSNGYRYRLHSKDLPGKPDIVLKKYKAAIFVNGCYWHRHTNCKYCYTPKTNTEFWQEKFSKNVLRDKNNYFKLNELGWKVIIVWECDVLNGSFKKDLINIIRRASGI